MGDRHIPIGVLGMVDGTLSISNCGIQSVQKNSLINSQKKLIEKNSIKIISDAAWDAVLTKHNSTFLESAPQY